MDRNFIIHIGDMLAGTTLDDNILFENKFSKRIDGLINGITGSIHIQHGDASTVMIEFDGFSADIYIDCDVCGNNVRISLSTEPRQTKWMKNVEKSLLKENDYLITDTSRIDLEEAITEDLLLSMGLRYICTNCQKNDDEQESETSYKIETNPIIRK